MVFVAVDEIARPRPHEHENRDVEPGFRVANQLDGRCRSTLRKIGAQLDAMRATFRGGERGIQRFDRGFNEHG